MSSLHPRRQLRFPRTCSLFLNGETGTHSAVSFVIDDTRTAHRRATGNQLGVGHIGIHAALRVKKPHPQQPSALSGITFLPCDGIKHSQCSGRIAQPTGIDPLRIIVDFGIAFAVTTDIRTSVGFRRIRPPIGRKRVCLYVCLLLGCAEVVNQEDLPDRCDPQAEKSFS